MTSLSIIIRIFRILFLLSFKKIMILLSSYRIIQFFHMIEYAWKKRGEERRNRDYKYDETDQQTLQSSFKSIFIFIFTILSGFSFFCVWIFVSRVIKKRLLIPFCYLLFWYKSKSIHNFSSSCWSNISVKVVEMREIVHIQTGQCGNQIGVKVSCLKFIFRKSTRRTKWKLRNKMTQHTLWEMFIISFHWLIQFDIDSTGIFGSRETLLH